MTYRFVQGIDYGPRPGTLGISYHMAEGGDGTVGWLAKRSSETNVEWRTRVRGVSCHVVILSTGEIVQMLKWTSACGNLNPNDRAEEYGYYGHHHLVDVLGDHWTDPNAWTVSAEITGFRAEGPNAKQRDAAIAWGLEMRAMFPSIRGATGHHDQSPKGCPGLTPNMKSIFAGVGGHGLFSTEAPVKSPTLPAIPTLVMVKANAMLFDNSELIENDKTITVNPARNMPLIGSVGATSTNPAMRIVEYVDETGSGTNVGYFMLATAGGVQIPAPLPPPDAVSCKPFVDEDRAKAFVAWKP